MTIKKRKITPPEVRFWKYVTKGGPDECWLWTGNKGTPYSVFWDGENQIASHRYALTLRLGRSIAPGMCALHTCDTPACCNPAHLFEGTNADNSKDMVSKGRKERGIDVNMAVLTEEKVRAIRREYKPYIVTCKTLGERYGANTETIWHVVKGLTWKHVK